MARYPGVRRSPNGRAIQVRFEHRGRKFSKTLPLVPTDANLRRAARELAKWRAEVELGLADGGSNADLSFAEVAQQFLDAFTGKASTRESYRGLLQTYWMPDLAERPFAQIPYRMLRAIDGRTDWPSDKTRKNAISVLRQAFAYGVEEDLRADNPASQFRVRKIQRKGVDPYTAEERETLLDWIARHSPPTPRMFAFLAFLTGMRTGEILALRWKDLDLARGRILVSHNVVRGDLIASTKTSDRREVPMMAELARRVRAHPRDLRCEHVLVTQYGQRYTDGDKLLAKLREAHTATGIRYRGGQHNPYPWRHTFACIGLTVTSRRPGVPPALLARWLGHSLETFYRVYADWIPSDADQAALEALDETVNLGGS